MQRPTMIVFGDVPHGAPSDVTYDPETDTTVVHAPDFGAEHLLADEEDG